MEGRERRSHVDFFFFLKKDWQNPACISVCKEERPILFTRNWATHMEEGAED